VPWRWWWGSRRRWRVQISGLRGDSTGTSPRWSCCYVLLSGPAESVSVLTLCLLLLLLLLFSSAVTHSAAVLSRLLWDATAAKLSFSPSLPLRCLHTLPLSHFPLSVFFSFPLSSLLSCAEDKGVNNSKHTFPFFYSCFSFPHISSLHCFIIR